MTKQKRAKKSTQIKYDGSVVVTRIALGFNISNQLFDELSSIARHAGILRSDLWNKYGSTSGWSVHKYIIDKEFRRSTPPQRYGLTSKLYERTLYKCVDEIHTYHDAVKAAVIKEIYHKTSDETERSYYLFLLNTRHWLSLNTRRAKWLHRLIRKHLKRGHSHCRNQIVYNCDMYKVTRKGNRSFIELASLVKGKRLTLPLHGSPDISGEIKVLLHPGNRVEIHYPSKRVKQSIIGRELEVGIDRGFSEVYVDSNGNFYGEGFGEIITEAVNHRQGRARKRGKLHSLAQKAIDKGNHHRSERIRKNNLGKIKMTRLNRSVEGRLKTLVFTATIQLFLKYSTVYYEDLTEPIKDRKKLKGRAAAKMSSWCKGLVADALEQVSVRMSAQVKAVNAAYTSQLDSRYGVLLGTRKGDSFHCFDGVVLQADINAAQNILARKDDAEITRYMKFTCVKLVLVRRTEQYKEQWQRVTAETLDSQQPVQANFTGFKGEQRSLFDITLTHSESEV